ncbi:hypothetical protein CVT24_002402 [Panaeolus cyanescens]|uniref:Uncharacterized protein n=1 Tax=Panaeolus cyanescens TaxID=181874 RepID=A0A409X4W1_9AGAR|nr:hypothetical protein CVT24_002402 [Panaeolus cyanescens]
MLSPHSFRQISTFGASTIRKFASNTSEMKKLAARDFEDILQCCIPVFDGILPDHSDDPEIVTNSELLRLLYRTAEFHAFAKMRMHTEETLQHLEEVTSQFAKLIRYFERKTNSSKYNTMETPSESARRARASSQRAPAGAATPSNALHSKRPKKLNLSTYKFHSLGDYAPFIRLFGGSDSFSTQAGELAHRLVKRLYAHTNKRNVAQQIGKRVRRLERARLAREQRLRRLQNGTGINIVVHREHFTINSDVDTDAKYVISPSENHKISLSNMIISNRGDPAYKPGSNIEEV